MYRFVCIALLEKMAKSKIAGNFSHRNFSKSNKRYKHNSHKKCTCLSECARSEKRLSQIKGISTIPIRNVQVCVFCAC